ncbi:hypothetical protein Tsubulata_031453 [Turnera subulata]|uniref:Pentacotripeptide-repeat region of PRORP domain-containing protein n=1 Tax=Turnera subulata TaxID=218843 RepID=A0A9Q0JDA0_9ROSI|nr:hypothetical protein Tsubulata_031453 [Turnera subulata]
MKQFHFMTKLSSLLHKNHETHFPVAKVVASFFSTKTLNQAPPPPSPEQFQLLYGRIKSITDPKDSVLPVLEQWVEEGRPLEKHQLQALIGRLRDLNRVDHALEVSRWMTDRRYLDLSVSDVAVRLQLIYRVHGLSQAENYFDNISEKLKRGGACGSLLSIYAREKAVHKAGALMQTMRDRGIATSSFHYNMLINLYIRAGLFDKIDILMQEMESHRIPQDRYTMCNLMAAYVAASDISSMERILNQVEQDPEISRLWEINSIAASGYIKVGMIEKALVMLRKLEDKMIKLPRKNTCFNFLLSHYASIGDKNELFRVWDARKLSGEITNRSYREMIVHLSQLDDIEGAEKIFKEWESQCSVYDFRVLDCILAAYCRKGLFEKAESTMENAAKGREPYASSWFTLAKAYVEHDKMPKAVEMLKRAISRARRRVHLYSVTMTSCLDYLEREADVEGLEEILCLLEKVHPLSREFYHRLLRTYIAAGKSVTKVLDRMKTDNLAVDEDTQKTLETKPKFHTTV